MSGVNQGVLTLTAPRAIEEELVDSFLDNQHEHGFTSLHVRGHSSDHSDLSPIEQVTGRQQQVQFQIFVDESEADEICERLKATFADVGMRYCFLLSSRQGHF